jgi:uncharacterized YccA/Bax inhibitor family protein
MFGVWDRRVPVAQHNVCEPPRLGTTRKRDTIMAALGIFLIVVGAIVTFAIDTAVDGVNLEILGYILMAGGVIALLVAAFRAAAWSSATNSKMHSERHVSDDGRHVVEDTRTA